MASSVSSIVTASCWAGVAGVAGVGVGLGVAGLGVPGVADPGVVGARCIIAGEEPSSFNGKLKISVSME